MNPKLLHRYLKELRNLELVSASLSPEMQSSVIRQFRVPRGRKRKKIVKVRGRPWTFYSLTDRARKLIEPFWPFPLQQEAGSLRVEQYRRARKKGRLPWDSPVRKKPHLLAIPVRKG